MTHAESLDVGLSTSGTRIEATRVHAQRANAPTVLIIGGLHGNDESVAAVRAVGDLGRKVSLLTLALANPDGVPLQFPPSGIAYRENREAHALWRWIGTHAPDLVLVAGRDDFGLTEALSQHVVAGMGRIPARAFSASELQRLDAVQPSQAARELQKRLARSPQQLAQQLARHYGHEFDTPWYISGMALIGRARLGELEDVKRLAEPYVNGSRDSLARPSSLVLAGHLVFAELARRTGDARYVQMVRKVANLGFEADGRMKESMPWHDQYSDSVFMATPIVAQAGALTGERRYFDLAARHFRFMQDIVMRPDGLYRHQPLTDAAWGRGNAFVAMGLALTLSEFPTEHPDYGFLRRAYQEHMATLVRFQDADGLWRNVIDRQGSYPELSATAMIGFAMLRGLRNGWLESAVYAPAVEKAWRAVLARTSAEGEFIDVCESTPRMKAEQDYLDRAAILGRDPRGGAMALMFATEQITSSRE